MHFYLMLRKPLLWLLTLLLTAALMPAYAQAVHAQDETALDIVEYSLDNGLDVILVEDSSAPTVAVSVWYDVGSANDPENRSGFAHLFEHLMFQGSANVAPGEHFRLIAAAGGNANATTGIDRTNYFETLPAHQLPLALWLEAERMRSLRITQENFAREREVVKEEYRMGVENAPYGEAQLLLQTLPFDYPPYQTPPIGSIEDLNAATLEEVLAFHDAYYKPNNASLAVAGDIDIEETRALIQRYFGGIAEEEAPPTLPPAEFSVQEQAQVITVTDELAQTPATFIAYRIPPRDDPDYYALEVLGRILGVGASSRLAQALLDTGQAAAANVFVQGNVGPSLFATILVPNVGISAATLEETFYEELSEIREEGVDEEELTKAINQIRVENLNALDRAIQLAESVQAADFYLDDPEAVLDDLARYQEVTSADIQRVADEYLTEESRNVIVAEPAQTGPAQTGTEGEEVEGDAGTSPQAVQPSLTPTATVTITAGAEMTGALPSVNATVAPQAPAPEATATQPRATQAASTPAATATPVPATPLSRASTATATATITPAAMITGTTPLTDTIAVTRPTPLPVQELSLPDFEEIELENDLSVIVVPQHQLPLLSVILVMPGGESIAPDDQTGVAALTASLLTRGTENRTAQEIASAIEQTGGQLQASAGRDATSVQVSVLSENVEQAMELLGDVVLQPTFPANELEIQRQQQLTGLQASLGNPSVLASRTFNEVLYGDHPYGEQVEAEELRALTREDVVTFYERQFHPETAFLVFVGDITPEEAVELAQETFGDWTPPATSVPITYPTPPERSEQQIYLIDSPGATQANVLLGHLLPAETGEDRFALAVANQVLGAGPSSRLFQNLREEQGFTYGIYSNLTNPRDQGALIIQTSVRNEVVEPALSAIVDELQQLRTEQVPADELQSAEDYLIGNFALQTETADAVASRLLNLRLEDLPLEQLEEYPQNIAAVTQRELRQVVQEYLQPDELAIVVVGDASQIQSDLEEIAPVTLVEAPAAIE